MEEHTMKFRRILPLVLLLAILFLLPFGAEAAENSCGEKATWRMSSAGVLYIEGTGDMYDYDMNNLPPWYSRRDEITTIDIGINITHIGDYAFYGCSNVTIIRNMRVKSIGTYAMSCCSKLKNVIVPEGVTVLDRYTFQGCTGLKTVVLPSTLEVIDQRAFMDCSGMIGIEIPASVTKINYEAFFGCSGLLGITFTGDAPAISTSAFRVVNATARYPEGNATWNADTKKNYGGVLTWEESPAYDGRCGFDVYWRMDGTNLNLFGSGPMDSYFITNDVKNTWKTATTVTVGEGITAVCGFSELRGLTSVSLPSTLTTIKGWAFSGATGLQSITLPSGLKELGDYAF